MNDYLKEILQNQELNSIEKIVYIYILIIKVENNDNIFNINYKEASEYLKLEKDIIKNSIKTNRTKFVESKVRN